MKSLSMRWAQKYVTLLMVLQSVAVFTLSYQRGWELQYAILASSIIALLTGFGLERVKPYRVDWNRAKNDVAVDLSSALILVALMDPLLKLFMPWFSQRLMAWLAVSEMHRVIDWLPAEIFVVTLLIEFGKYWSHRFHHQVTSLWRMHRLHHSSERLYTLNNLRFHPINYAINLLMGVFPAILLGFSGESIMGYLAVTQPILLIQHMNFDSQQGYLNKLFSTNEVHRLHHTTERRVADSNYGNAIMLWDHLFGTYLPATEFGEFERVGLFPESEGDPVNLACYFSQLTYGFNIPCCLNDDCSEKSV